MSTKVCTNFEFHHRNPSEKEFHWGKLRLRKQETIQKELDKCDLLCANCHRLTHAEVDLAFPEQ